MLHLINQEQTIECPKFSYTQNFCKDQNKPRQKLYRPWSKGKNNDKYIKQVKTIMALDSMDEDKSSVFPSELALPPPPEPQTQQFDCPRQGCTSKIEINDDICRFIII
jgi:hypothetical protein